MNRLANKITLIALALLVLSCKKGKDEDEPFSDKLKITTSYYNTSASYIYNSEDKVITVNSGSAITFNYSIGGADGFGNSTVKDEVVSFNYTKETASGVVTCTYVKQENLVNAENTSVAVNEDTKFTFTITSKDGETATVGPIEIKVLDNNEIVTGVTSFVTESNNCFNCYKFFAPYMDNGGLEFFYYNNINSFFNPEFAVLGAVVQGSDMYLVSPSQFTTLGAYGSLTSAYSCGWNTTTLQSYTGSINVVTDLATLTNLSLDTLTIGGSNETLMAVPNNSFVFKTAEGKKGIAKFSDNSAVPYSNSVSFTFAYQK